MKSFMLLNHFLAIFISKLLIQKEQINQILWLETFLSLFIKFQSEGI